MLYNTTQLKLTTFINTKDIILFQTYILFVQFQHCPL